MSKRVVAFQNNTDSLVVLDWRMSGTGGAVSQLGPLGKGKHLFEFNIPDNSKSSSYWATNHVHVSIFKDGKSLGSMTFWDDDWDSYKIKYCEDVGLPNDANTKLMRGGDHGGNYTNVVLHLSEHPDQPGKFELTAVAVDADEQKKKIALTMKDFTGKTGMIPGLKYSPQELRNFMNHEAFGAVRDSVEEGGYGSLALVAGGGGSFGAGAEFMVGTLMGIESVKYYRMSSWALTLGAEEGAVAFGGLYTSTEAASEVGGFEFFGEFGADLGVGMAIRVFTTFGGGRGMLVLMTTGEELELSVGLGRTTTSPFPA